MIESDKHFEWLADHWAASVKRNEYCCPFDRVQAIVMSVKRNLGLGVACLASKICGAVLQVDLYPEEYNTRPYNLAAFADFLGFFQHKGHVHAA